MSDALPQDRSQLDGFRIKIVQLVKREAPPTQWVEWLRVPLEHAATESNAKHFSRLISTRSKDGTGWRVCRIRTLIVEAAQNRNQLDGVEIELLQLVKRRASPDQWAEWLRVPLEHAAAEGDSNLFRRIMNAGASTGAGWRGCGGRTLLCAAAQGSDESVVTALLDAGANPEVNVLFSISSYMQLAALHVAARQGAGLVSKVLMDAGADPNLRCSEGQSPLHFAAEAGSPWVVRLLLLNGALPNVVDAWMRTPLHFCGFNPIPDSSIKHFAQRRALCASKLIAAGALVDAKSSEGWTPLSLAVQIDLVGVVEALLADCPCTTTQTISTQEEARPCLERESALLCTAARFASTGIVIALLRHGCIASVWDNEGTALHHAARRSDNGDNARALLAAGAFAELYRVWETHGGIWHSRSFSHHAEHSVTPLHVAVIEGTTTIGPLLALLEGKANIHARTSGGRTALHIACRMSNAVAVGLLLRWGADETLLDARGKTAADAIGDVQHTYSTADETQRNSLADQSIRQMLARAPAERSWRRRGWLVLFRSFSAKVPLDAYGNKFFRRPAAAALARKTSLGGGSENAGNTSENLRSLVDKVVGVEMDELFRLILKFL